MRSTSTQPPHTIPLYSSLSAATQSLQVTVLIELIVAECLAVLGRVTGRPSHPACPYQAPHRPGCCRHRWQGSAAATTAACRCSTPHEEPHEEDQENRASCVRHARPVYAYGGLVFMAAAGSSEHGMTFALVWERGFEALKISEVWFPYGHMLA